MARTDISWVRPDAEGEKIELRAHQIGVRWDFYWRQGRHHHWEALEEPLLEDWLEVLDGVRRRAQRRQYAPDDAAKVEALIRKRFPGVQF